MGITSFCTRTALLNQSPKKNKSSLFQRMQRQGEASGNLQPTGGDLGRESRRTKTQGCCSAVAGATAVAPDAQVFACSDFDSFFLASLICPLTSTLSTLALFVSATSCKSARTGAALRLATEVCSREQAKPKRLKYTQAAANTGDDKNHVRHTLASIPCVASVCSCITRRYLITPVTDSRLAPRCPLALPAKGHPLACAHGAHY